MPNEEKITGELRNLGYVPPVLKSTDIRLGAISKMPSVIVNEKGDYSASYPKFESQLRPKFDSHGCTCYACNNAAEMYLKHVFGFDFDCAERYHYNILRIRPPGADPLKVLQSMRDDGAIRESRLPVTDTFAEFITPDPMTLELLKEGRRFKYKLWYETLWLGKISKAKRRAIIRDNARKGTIVFSVTAYFKKGDVYVDNGLDNSHLVAYGAERENGFEIFDSYEDDGKPIKIISFDHDIRFAARIVLTPIEESEQINWALSLLRTLANSLRNLIMPVKETHNPPAPAPVVPIVTPPTAPVVISNRERLYDMAKACLGKDIAKTQDELGCAEAVNYVYKKTFGTPIGGETSTAGMYEVLKKDKRFVKVDEPLFGDIIISPTGTSTLNALHGHVGIVAKYGILSNNSLNGLWQEKFTLQSWKIYYTNRGFPVYYYRVL